MRMRERMGVLESSSTLAKPPFMYQELCVAFFTGETDGHQSLEGSFRAYVCFQADGPFLSLRGKRNTSGVERTLCECVLLNCCCYGC